MVFWDGAGEVGGRIGKAGFGVFISIALTKSGQSDRTSHRQSLNRIAVIFVAKVGMKTSIPWWGSPRGLHAVLDDNPLSYEYEVKSQ